MKMSRIADIDIETGHPMTDSKSRITLLDLPVLPKDRDFAAGTSIIMDAFISDRDSVKNHYQLCQFIEKWRNIWLLNKEAVEKYTTQEEFDIVSLNFDMDVVFNSFVRMLMKDDNLDFEDRNVIIAMNLCIPNACILVFKLSNHYGVGNDLGFVRLFLDPYPEFVDELRI